MEEENYKNILDQLDYYNTKGTLPISLYKNIEDLIKENREYKKRINDIQEIKSMNLVSIITKDKQ
jgi:hypothetical protein